MIFNAFYEAERAKKKNKKRIAVVTADGETRFTFYDYGNADYLFTCYSDIFRDYKIVIYNIGEKKPLCVFLLWEEKNV